MRLGELVATSRRVAETPGRNDKVGLLADLLRRAPPEEVEILVSFLSGAPRQGRLGIGPGIVLSGQTAPRDASPGNEANEALDLRQVDDALGRIARLSGPGSAAAKAQTLRQLLEPSAPDERDFLRRLLLGELRQGAVEGLLLEAVAKASGIDAARVRRAAMMAGELGPVAVAALTRGEAGLVPFQVRLFRPVQPMLAQPAADASEALQGLTRAQVEVKLDGARIQVHKAGDEVRVYTRALKEVTAAVPEVVEAARALPARELIADGETLALKPDGSPHPFQVTMRRYGRRLDVDALRNELPLSPFLFDLLYLDGEDLLDQPLSRRLQGLRELTPEGLRVPGIVAASPDEVEAFFEETLRRGHEGVMLKALDSPYEAGSRGSLWRKLKPAHTLDLVVLAAEWGSGRREGWLSNLHLGARDVERGGFVMLGKTFKGLTDEVLAWQTQRLSALEIGRDAYTVFVRPELVVEIAFADVQASPRYPGGLALRFARVKRYRADKPASEADTFGQVQDIYRRATGGDPPPRR